MRPSVPDRGRFALAGVLAAGVALGLGHLIAGLTGPDSSPVAAVGAVVIEASPQTVTNFAISTFGVQDKVALLIGTVALVALIAAGLGLASRRRPLIGVLGIIGFGLVGAAAALTRPDADLLATAPALVGAIGGAGALVFLLRPLNGVHAVGVESVHRGRRGFLLTGAVAVGFAAVSGGLGSALQRRFDVSRARAAIQIPVGAAAAPTATTTQAAPPTAAIAFDQIDGLSPLFTPNDEFYRIDTALVLPQIMPEEWSLRIHGRVQRELRLTFADLIARDDLIERDITLSCVSNEVGGPLVGGARWVGVPLANLLEEAGVEPGAVQVVTRSSDGWTCGTPTADCLETDGAMLAISMNGEPLPVEHGFPVRMIVPGLYGYVSATKWIVDMELTGFAEFDPYWVRRGWDRKAPIQTAARIDTPTSEVPAGMVAVAGVAWTGLTGISKVEVRIDEGEWTEAQLSAPTSESMWRQWALQWSASSGRHSIAVRASDGDGRTQAEQRRSPYPNAASGWHAVFITVR